MEYKWISQADACGAGDIVQLIEDYIGNEYLYLAGCTDSYDSGRNNLVDFINRKQNELLELRVFTKEKEILFSRSMIGQGFKWRLTCDDMLDATDYLDIEQYIDINENRSSVRNDNMLLYTTVGGAYSLPIQPGDNAVQIRAYITYDNYGMASVADHRVCGFVKK